MRKILKLFLALTMVMQYLLIIGSPVYADEMIKDEEEFCYEDEHSLELLLEMDESSEEINLEQLEMLSEVEEMRENIVGSFSGATINFTQQEGLVLRPVHNSFKRSFTYVMERHPNWARHVREVRFVSGLDVNYARAFTNLTASSYGRIEIGGRNDTITEHNLFNITFHEIAHLIDTFDNVNTRDRYAVYTGRYSTYRVGGRNFYEIWRGLGAGNRLDENIRESFAIAVGRFMANSRDGGNRAIPAAFIPYLQQLTNDVSAGRNATPPNHDVRITRSSTGNNITDGAFQLNAREVGYESFFTTFTVANVGNVTNTAIGPITATLSDFQINGVNSNVSPFTFGNDGTSVLIRDFGNLAPGASANVNIRTRSGLGPGTHSARFTVTSTINGVEVINRHFTLRITIISSRDVRLLRTATGNNVTGGEFRLNTRQVGYESFFTTFTVENISHLETGNLTATLSHFQLDGININTAPFTFGNDGTHIVTRNIESLAPGGSSNFNIRTRSGLGRGNHSARVTVTGTINGVEVINRYFTLRITIN